MRIAVRVALWVLLLSGSAGAGAFIAAHSNPLPPQVVGSPSPSVAGPSTGPSPDLPAATTWVGTIRSTSFHRLYVGGTCTTAWATRVRFEVAPRGAVRGRGVAKLTSQGSPCPFPIGQRQIRRFRLGVTGELRAGELALRLIDLGHVPAAGSDDLGGFRATTLSIVMHARVRHDAVEARVSLQAPDQDRGAFGSTNMLRLRCRDC